MISQQQTIAVLASNPAFASIISAALEDSGHRTVVFSSLPALSTFLRIAPVDLAVLNLDLPWAQMIETVRALKAGPRIANPLLKAVVLSPAVPLAGLHLPSGIDALLVKPVTPAQLMSALSGLLEGEALRSPAPRLTPVTRSPKPRAPVTMVRQGNVFPLFGYRATP